MTDDRFQRRSPEEDGRLKLDQLAHYGREARKESKEHYLEDSKERLKKNIEAKIRTTMIGALSHLEQTFGFLWGQGKPQHALTDQEIAMRDLKDKLRTEILNQGNQQLRAAKAEIDQYKVEWMRYSYTQDISQQSPPHPIFGLDDNGNPKRLRYGTNPDGSIKTSVEG